MYNPCHILNGDRVTWLELIQNRRRSFSKQIYFEQFKDVFNAIAGIEAHNRFDIFVACEFTDMTRLDIEAEKKIDSLESNIERVCVQKFDSFDDSTNFSSSSWEF